MVRGSWATRRMGFIGAFTAATASTPGSGGYRLLSTPRSLSPTRKVRIRPAGAVVLTMLVLATGCGGEKEPDEVATVEPRLITRSGPVGGSSEAQLEGRVTVNARNCAEVGGALLVAPEGWRLSADERPDSGSAVAKEPGVVHVNAELSFSGGYRDPNEDQSVDLEDCVTDETTAIFYISGVADPDD